ncbi:hypothetical protein DPMN_078632 [Dreissena polymorpha]|uniref:Uncharacterized protein n=1 Tax=Dreissena polymorpha TaxID=45954 RepID=A0A9D4BPC1_DREPO|nr:hypothetical protein DPMN_078632 [Dreissena polymorpha]
MGRKGDISVQMDLFSVITVKKMVASVDFVMESTTSKLHSRAVMCNRCVSKILVKRVYRQLVPWRLETPIICCH